MISWIVKLISILTQVGDTNWAAVASSADGNRLFAAVNGGGIYTLETTPTPVVEIAISRGSLTLSWIIPSTPFVLQESADLTAANWVDVTVERTLNFSNLHYQATLPLSGDRRFYRLARVTQ